jgi:hypothetical protein
MDLDTVSFRGCFLDVWILEGSLIQELDSFGFLPAMLKLNFFVSEIGKQTSCRKLD